MTTSEIKSRLIAAGLRPNKLLGQHFLIDQNVLKKIVAQADVKPSETILEIGPGLGILTFDLAKRAKRVMAVEKDRQMFEVLEKEIRQRGVKNIELVRDDILRLAEKFFRDIREYRVIANIPYYLTSRLIRKLLAEVSPPQEIILMVQKEVAERMMARPPQMNLLALSVQAYGRPKKLFSVSRESFWPPPLIDSALISISAISKNFFTHHHIPEKKFFEIARRAFQTKRKTILNGLAQFSSKQKLEKLLRDVGIDPNRRPETLSLLDWIAIVSQLEKGD
ncbi:MAG: ribosomal RNA small subunit methyltransferase A [Candidatus Sungbacteria bacterium]|uniref:Ribosomal RNA small subunit methyltransferase A n=1 Tax=Candidatus Sungiibacteriota bacterium TaxID=2750080 RepID=A0A9D6LRJ9_9BACT|nr:ribosomal RNA small subunit methyltransferase A [Candidatus Sungbacteria bacterium]